VTQSHEDDVLSLATVAAENGAELSFASSTASRQTQQTHVTQPPVLGASGRQGICTRARRCAIDPWRVAASLTSSSEYFIHQASHRAAHVLFNARNLHDCARNLHKKNRQVAVTHMLVSCRSLLHVCHRHYICL